MKWLLKRLCANEFNSRERSGGKGKVSSTIQLLLCPSTNKVSVGVGAHVSEAAYLPAKHGEIMESA